MEVHKAELFYTDPNTKKNKSIIAEGKDEGDAAQNAVKRFKTFFLTYLLLVLLELIR